MNGDGHSGGIPALAPLDEHNERLRAHTHPEEWRNPTPSGRYNLVVIGGGPAGLVAAAATAGLGGKVALIERGLLGGDCLNTGCVPSKALIRCARAAAEVRGAARFGVRVAGSVEVNFAEAMARMRRLRADMSAHDAAARFSSLGVDVYLGEGRFEGRDQVAAAGQTLHFSKALIATGARAAVPPIEGIEEAGCHTNETIFSLTELPRRLAVLGAGPIGCEMAQCFARFGAEVTLIEAGDRILPRDDPEAAAIVAAAMARDWVRILCGAKTVRVRVENGAKRLEVIHGGRTQEILAGEILAAAGRVPNIEGLGLDAAGVAHDPREGVRVNDRLRTSNPRIFAAGDVASRFRFTHAADAMARIVVQNALFFGRGKVSALTIPWATYTDPEVAHVGMPPAAAAREGAAIATITIPMSEVDRAIVDGETEGFVRIHHAKGSDKILGATIVARHASDMIAEIVGIMNAGKGLRALAKTIHPYPAQTDAIKKAADAYNRTRLTPAAARLLKTVLAWRR